MRAGKILLCAALAAALGGVPAAGPRGAEVSRQPAGELPNVLVLLADDLGIEFLSLYDAENVLPPGIAERTPHVYPQTPTLARLAAEGVRFTQARVMPTCSATRASILGGRYPFRHGIGALVRSSDSSETLSGAETIEFGVGPGNREVTLAHLARAAGLRSLHAGKWHLALKARNLALGGEPGADWPHIREVGGFDDAWGIWGNLGERSTADSYWGFEANENGEPLRVESYATTAQVDRILEWTAEHDERPWLVYAAFNAVHAPFELPPEELVATAHYLEALTVSGVRKRTSERSDWPAWCAMIEALDHELGRLLDGLEARGELDDTLVIFIGDNGSPERVMGDAYRIERLGLGETFGKLVKRRQERFKHTVWECGVRVPLLVRGPGVEAPGRSSDALVDAPDLWATIAELLDVDTDELAGPEHALDGVSFLDVLRSSAATGKREFSLVEHFAPNGNPELIVNDPEQMGVDYLLRRGFVLATEDGLFKLVRNWDMTSGKGRDRLYQLSDADGNPVDPWEREPLPTGEEAPAREVFLRLKSRLDQLLHSEASNWEQR